LDETIHVPEKVSGHMPVSEEDTRHEVIAEKVLMRH
jgi:hypothetical protein